MRSTSNKIKISISLSVALIALGAFTLVAPLSSASTTIPLGTASTYGVLAGNGITNSGGTTITGDVGLNPITTYINSGAVTRLGNIHIADPAAVTAIADATTAYNAVAAQTSTVTVVTDLGGKTLTPGVYSSVTGLSVTGTVTLDAGGNQNAVFIFQTPATLTTSNLSSIKLINGAYAGNVYWQIGTTATLGSNSTMTGIVLDNAGGIISGLNATTEGSLISLHGAITLADAFITVPFPQVLITVTPVVNPTGCPVFISQPTITGATDNSLTISWVAGNTGSWQLMTHATQLLGSNVGSGGIATVGNLVTYSSNTQTVILWSGSNFKGCRVTQAVTGTTTGGPVLAPLPPVVTPPVVTPPVVTPPVVTPPVQVTTPPTGPVKTGDGSLGRLKK